MKVVTHILFLAFLLLSFPLKSQNQGAANLQNYEESVKEMVIDIMNNIDQWEAILQNETSFNAERMALMCLQRQSQNCSFFAYQSMIAFNLIHYGNLEIPQTHLNSYNAMLDRVAPNCIPPNNCLEERVQKAQYQNIHAYLNQIQNFDFDDIYQKFVNANPNEVPTCQLFTVNMLVGFYLNSFDENDKRNHKQWFDDFAYRYNQWFRQKSAELSNTPRFREIQSFLNTRGNKSAENIMRSICPGSFR